jgi:uncharacterized protein (TIGR00255 family)
MADFGANPMIRSMTGFARRERQFPWGLLAWELRTVNHRFLEIGCACRRSCDRWKRTFASRSRGACAAARSTAHCISGPASPASLQVDVEPLLKAVTQRARQVAASGCAAARIDVMDVLRWPGVVRDARATARR